MPEIVIPEQKLTKQSVQPIVPTEKLYKTPNYKGKKKSSTNYETKHNTKDIESHDALMKKKYGVKLSIRKDVVNKTLFRALKRFYTDQFMSQFTLTKKESSESYLQKVRVFCQQLFGQGMLATATVTYEQIEKFLSILISPNHIKKMLVNTDDLALYEEFYSCLYQYSHKKLARMLTNPVCGYLFTDFVVSGNLTQFITTCTTMNQNAEVYESASKSFLMLISGEDPKALKSGYSKRASKEVV